MSERQAKIERNTNETRIVVEIDIDGSGRASLATGIPFLDHMLDQVARHGMIDLTVRAEGDLHIDAHHTVEDVGITFGQALAQALGDKRGIRRYGDALVPMEEALVQVALDLSGRPLLVYDAPIPFEAVGQYDTALTEEFLQAFVRSAGLTLHVRLLAGRNAHHMVEAVFKAVARALGDAVSLDSRAGDSVPSTKGVL